jgi:hypothetical protein
VSKRVVVVGGGPKGVALAAKAAALEATGRLKDARGDGDRPAEQEPDPYACRWRRILRGLAAGIFPRARTSPREA